jgi:putative flippase GtrA
MVNRRFILFLVVGGFAALANFASRIGLSELMPYIPSIILAYCIGMATAFVLNRLFVFKDSRNHLRHQAMWFVLVNLAAVVQTVVISVLLVRWLFPAIGWTFHPQTVAHAVGVAIPVVTSYLGHKHLSFRNG